MSESAYKKALRFQEMMPEKQKKLFSPGTRIMYTRILSFLPDMIDRLEEAQAPIHVYRWIGFGKKMSDRIVRMALALRFRRPLDERRLGNSETGLSWLKNAEQSVAEKLFYKSPQGAGLRAWIDKNMLTMYGRNGSMEHDFWSEIDKRVNAIDVPTFLNQVDQLVLAKPMRKMSVHEGRRRRTVRARLTKSQVEALQALLKDHVNQNHEENGDA